MKSDQVLCAAEQVVATLLSLRWQRIGNTDRRVWVEDVIQNQTFHFYNKGGAVACVVEFIEMKFNDGLGYILIREGKISNANGDIILEEKELFDNPSYSVYEPKKHPLNDVYDIVWGKESGEPVSQEGKFPETLTLERFTEELRA